MVEAERIDQHVPMTEVRGALRAALDADRPRPAHRRARALRPHRRRRDDRLHHAAEPQFLRRLQPGAGDLHRRAVPVPRPGRAGRPARAAPRPHRATTRCSTRRSTRRSGASPGATTSSSAPAPRPAVARHMSVTGGMNDPLLRPAQGRRAGRPGAARHPRSRRAAGRGSAGAAPSCSTPRSGSPSTTR